MPDPTNEQREIVETSKALYVLYSAPGMLALCLTMIGLIKIYGRLEQTETLGDDFLAFNGVLFLASFICSYLALRTANKRRRIKLERIADAFFLGALVVLSIVAIFVTYTLKG
jgi:hypothetical protein